MLSNDISIVRLKFKQFLNLSLPFLNKLNHLSVTYMLLLPGSNTVMTGLFSFSKGSQRVVTVERWLLLVLSIQGLVKLPIVVIDIHKCFPTHMRLV